MQDLLGVPLSGWLRGPPSLGLAPPCAPVPRVGIEFDRLEMPCGSSSPDIQKAGPFDLLLWACRAESLINIAYR